jgi:hypothetical protein
VHELQNLLSIEFDKVPVSGTGPLVTLSYIIVVSIGFWVAVGFGVRSLLR